MNRHNQARMAATDRIVAEARARWSQMTEDQRGAAVERVCNSAGISRETALDRLTGTPCPHCGSTDIDRGATDLDACNACGGLSRNGQTLRAAAESAEG